MHKEENLSFSGSAEQHAPAQELQNLTPRNRVTVGRRSFIRGLGIVWGDFAPGRRTIATPSQSAGATAADHAQRQL